MLFAKGILFVEGISEALLLPIFAEYLNRPLDKYAVEVINVDGVSFKPFANLLCYANDTHQVTIKATIITDDDRCTNKEDKETYIVKDIDYDTDDIDSIADSDLWTKCPCLKLWPHSRKSNRTAGNRQG